MRPIADSPIAAPGDDVPLVSIKQHTSTPIASGSIAAPDAQSPITGPPRHCCPFWRCEYVLWELAATATVNCGTGSVPFFGVGGMLKRVVSGPTYRRWEYRSQNTAPGVIEEVTIECNQEIQNDGKGPCPYISYYFNDGFGIIVGFGPILMDIRSCDCIDSDEPVPPDSVGYNWGTAYVSADAINAADQSAFPCTLSLTSGNDSLAICLCASCACYGYSKRMRLTWACASFPSDVVIVLNFYDAASLPAGASPAGTSLPYGLWQGETTVFGCRFEAMLRCAPGAVGPDLWLLGLRDAVLNDPCDLLFQACTTPNRYQISHRCRSATETFKVVWGFCTTSTAQCADGMTVSTVSIEEIQ